MALTITAMIGVILLGAFRIGLRAWEKGERDIEKHQRQRMVLNLMKEQIAAICLPQTADNDARRFLFQGDSQSLELVSRRSLLNAEGDGMVTVRYAVQPGETEARQQLLYVENNKLWMREPADGSDNNWPQADARRLIPEAYRIQFEYLDGNEDAGIEDVDGGREIFTWLPEWDSQETAGFPRAVRITLTPEPDVPPLRVIARLPGKLPYWGAIEQ